MEPSSLHDQAQTNTPHKGFVPIQRHFTSPGQDSFETVEWSRRNAQAGDFFQADVEAPTDWSDVGVGIVAKLYFATIGGVREHSVRQLIQRVAMKITLEGIADGYFPGIYEQQEPGSPGTENHPATIFYDELVYIGLHQYAVFNTPVWLNVGVPGRKQVCSACFLLSIKDKMLGDGGITDWWAKEAAIFKGGAGSGINLSTLRGSMEPLSTGGVASGPLAYMRTADSGAGTLKSGGAHRRAAKMIQLDADHPDVMDFIECKPREDERMRALMAAGFNLNPFDAEGERNIAETTSFQNGNISVRVSDEFMKRATGDRGRPETWPLFARASDTVVDTVDPKELLSKVANAAWQCADPGMMFDDTINSWHTTPSLGPITTSNPCGETHLNDDSACNLGSLNLAKFIPSIDTPSDVRFYIGDFRHVVDVMTTAMDITCSFSSLPTEEIERNTRDLRQLGLGYTNLGTALMVQGLAYDSDEGRDWAASVTALLTGRCYQRSAVLAEHLGSFKHFEDNRERMLGVIERHSEAIRDEAEGEIWSAARSDWEDAFGLGCDYGFRNSQATVIAPTGTTSYMLGADTTGCEPMHSLITIKSLAAAGKVVLVNASVHRALVHLGYDAATIQLAEDALRNEDIDGFMCQIMPEHQVIFHGANEISPEGHVSMLASIQPFLSGAASKTVNLANSATVDDILSVYVMAWRTGVKCIAVYRNGSKATQVLTTAAKPQEEAVVPYTPHPVRRKMPTERESVTHKFNIDGHEGYITAGKYEDGSLGEIFLTGAGKEGSTLQGLLSAWSIAISIGIQYGVPLETFVKKYSQMRFEPAGVTTNHEIPQATSIPDYTMRWAASRFGDIDLQDSEGVLTQGVKDKRTAQLDVMYGSSEIDPDVGALELNASEHRNGHHDLGNPCPECGGLLKRAGSCWQCDCGWSTGCG